MVRRIYWCVCTSQHAYVAIAVLSIFGERERPRGPPLAEISYGLAEISEEILKSLKKS